jgi:hypothetical protein
MIQNLKEEAAHLDFSKLREFFDLETRFVLVVFQGIRDCQGAQNSSIFGENYIQRFASRTSNDAIG